MIFLRNALRWQITYYGNISQATGEDWSNSPLVVIGIIDVIPQFIHQCVPSKNPNCFLIAFAINSSLFPLLAGDAAVYLNNSFVAKTKVKNVSFTCCLGVDPALNVDYKPVKKYHEQVGLISKISSTVYEKVIVVRNSRRDSVLLTIKEQIPCSTDEKIKVRMEGSKLDNGILEWTVVIHSGKSTELHVKWAIEHPKDEIVRIVERR
ncbi:unnamed protein product [Angiostrongylus costaricensis]|uniref:DUF4139 domain-containing protein n=1 Tax=Angiostrongylus costaricensis TaxID=334426 RepID=A0A0R3PLR1_ANGCS|nr:unnamed protein product [Angiostrongylus costaricensis]